MKKTITLFIEGFIEGWNGTSGKLTGNPPPPKATAARFDACTHLTAEELDTVFSLLAEPPCTATCDQPTEQAPQATDASRVTDVLDAGERTDVLRLLTEERAFQPVGKANIAKAETKPLNSGFLLP